MWEEPQYRPSARGDDLLAEIWRYQPGSTHPPTSQAPSPASLEVEDEWYDIGLLSDTPIRLPECDWTPMAAWLADRDMYARLWGSVNADLNEAIDTVDDEREMKNYEWAGGES